MTEKAHELCAKLAEDSIQIGTDTQSVYLDDATELSEQSYLRINGTPGGYRWLAKLLTEMADQVEANSSASAIVSPRDLDSVQLDGWDSLELVCKDRSLGASE